MTVFSVQPNIVYTTPQAAKKVTADEEQPTWRGASAYPKSGSSSRAPSEKRSPDEGEKDGKMTGGLLAAMVSGFRAADEHRSVSRSVEQTENVTEHMQVAPAMTEAPPKEVEQAGPVNQTQESQECAVRYVYHGSKMRHGRVFNIQIPKDASLVSSALILKVFVLPLYFL